MFFIGGEDVSPDEIIDYMKEIARSCQEEVERRVEREGEAWRQHGKLTH